jgi:hypothetical protein
MPPPVLAAITKMTRMVTANPVMTEAVSPSVAAGFCRISVNEPLRMSPTPRGRSGMPPQTGAVAER